MSIAAVLPSNDEATLLRHLLSPGSATILATACYAVCIASHGAGPSRSSLESRLHPGTALRVRRLDDEKSRHRMVHLRTEATRLAPDARFWLHLDDDIELRPGYMEGLHDARDFLEARPEFGAVLLASHFGGHPYGRRVIEFRGRHPATGHGILFRARPEGAWFPEGAATIVGGGEETLSLAFINSLGLRVAKRFNVHARHIHRRGGPKLLEKNSATVIHDVDIAQAGCFAVAADLLGVPRGKVHGHPVINAQFRKAAP